MKAACLLTPSRPNVWRGGGPAATTTARSSEERSPSEVDANDRLQWALHAEPMRPGHESIARSRLEANAIDQALNDLTESDLLDDDLLTELAASPQRCRQDI